MSWTYLVILLVFSKPCHLSLLVSNVDVNPNITNSMMKAISMRIDEYAKAVTSYQDIKTELAKLKDNNSLKIKKADNKAVLNEFKKHIENIFVKKTIALQNIKDKVLKVKKSYVYDKDLVKLDYINMRKINLSDNISIKIEKDFSSKILINMSKSFVQIPTNIYAYKPEILNTVRWTAKLDKTFKQNFKKSNKSLLFQFYGDRSGLFRVYPGTILGLEDKQKADFFDARRRVWYLQAISSPKDVVIMIDVSGSMVGSNIGIARITATSLIDTLGENDFFNVITVKNEVRYMRPCMKYLIQATKYNKEMMKIALQNVGEVNQSIKADKGIAEAFNILRSRNRTSASCNRAIMFISDGIESDYVGRDVFHANNANLSVRAFTFLIGQNQKNIKREGLLNMACKNRGYFYGIETIGNVWETVLHYMTVMSRPMIINNTVGTAVYSPLYLDATGQGMVMTMSMGIFDQKGVVGVAGTDILVDNIISKIPYWNIGVYSHMILVDNNGFAILHPKLLAQQGYLPSHRSVFLEDLVYGIKKEKIRRISKNMINQMSGDEELAIYWKYGNNKKLVLLNAEIYYTGIDKSEFSIAFVTPKRDSGYFDYDSSDKVIQTLFKKGIVALKKNTGNTVIRIANWPYCKKENDGNSPRSVESYYTATELKKLLDGNNTSKCSQDILRRLLVTAGIVDKYVNIDLMQKENKTNTLNNVFVSTSGGYVKSIYIAGKKQVIPAFKKVPYFDYTASNLNDLTISTPGSREENSTIRKIITITAAIRIEGQLHSVSGFDLNEIEFQKIILSSSKGIERSSYMIFLLDQNGIIVFSNQENRHVGRFIGEINFSLLVNKFENISIFKKVELYDTQAECEANKINKCMHSKSNFLTNPLRVFFKGLSVLYNSISLVLITYSTFLIDAVSASESGHKEEPTPNVSCTKEIRFYLSMDIRNKTFSKAEKRISCSPKCNMAFDIRNVDKTNLLLLVLNIPPECKTSCMKSSTKLGPVRIEEIPDNKERYRRKPKQCQNDVLKNETLTSRSMCGTGNNLIPSSLILTFFVFICWIFR